MAKAPVFNGSKLGAIRASELAHMDLAVEWLVPGVIPKHTGGSIVGPSAVGKTWAVLDLALAMVTDGLWLGKLEVNPGKVYIVDEENALALIKERLERMARGRGKKLEDLHDLVLLPLKGLDLTPRKSRSGEVEFTTAHHALIDDLNFFDCDLLIMDSLTRIHNADENSSTEMSAVFASLKDIMSQTEATVGFTHHYNKSGGPTSNRIRGSSDIRAWIDWAIAIEGISGDEDGALKMSVEHDKNRYGVPLGTWAVTMEKDEEGTPGEIIRFVDAGEYDKSKTGPKKIDAGLIWLWIKDQLGDGAMCGKALVAACKTLQPGFAKSTLLKEVTARVSAGQLTKEREGKAVYYSVVPGHEEIVDLDEFAYNAAKTDQK